MHAWVAKITLVWFILLCICMWTITVTFYLCYYCYVSVHTRINNKKIKFLKLCWLLPPYNISCRSFVSYWSMKIVAWLVYRPTLYVTCQGQGIRLFHHSICYHYDCTSDLFLIFCSEISMVKTNKWPTCHYPVFVFWLGLLINSSPREGANRQDKLLVLWYSGLWICWPVAT